MGIDVKHVAKKTVEEISLLPSKIHAEIGFVAHAIDVSLFHLMYSEEFIME